MKRSASLRHYFFCAVELYQLFRAVVITCSINGLTAFDREFIYLMIVNKSYRCRDVTSLCELFEEGLRYRIPVFQVYLDRLTGFCLYKFFSFLLDNIVEIV